MESPHHEFRVRWRERAPGIPTTHQVFRFRTEQKAMDFVRSLLAEHPDARPIIERRVVASVWERIGLRGGVR